MGWGLVQLASSNKAINSFFMTFLITNIRLKNNYMGLNITIVCLQID